MDTSFGPGSWVPKKRDTVAAGAVVVAIGVVVCCGDLKLEICVGFFCFIDWNYSMDDVFVKMEGPYLLCYLFGE